MKNHAISRERVHVPVKASPRLLIRPREQRCVTIAVLGSLECLNLSNPEAIVKLASCLQHGAAPEDAKSPPSCLLPVLLGASSAGESCLFKLISLSDSKFINDARQAGCDVAATWVAKSLSVRMLDWILSWKICLVAGAESSSGRLRQSSATGERLIAFGAVVLVGPGDTREYWYSENTDAVAKRSDALARSVSVTFSGCLRGFPEACESNAPRSAEGRSFEGRGVPFSANDARRCSRTSSGSIAATYKERGGVVGRAGTAERAAWPATRAPSG